jgi:hypothetical protein
VEDLGIKKTLRMGLHIIYQGSNKVLRLSTGGTDKYSVSPTDVVEHPVFGDEFIGIKLFPLSII